MASSVDEHELEQSLRARQTIIACQTAVDLDAGMWLGPQVLERVLSYIAHLEALLGEDG